MQSQILLDNLIVNPENYRFDPVKNQEEAIKLMITEQKEKLCLLAEDILKNGLNPTELPMVLKNNTDNNFLVLEGNRRITALKILANPNLLPKDLNDSLKSKYDKILNSNDNTIKITNQFPVNCVVIKNEDEALHWVQMKHTRKEGGAGVERWDALTQQRFIDKNYGIKSLSVQLIEYINSNKFIEEKYLQVLGNLPSTNIERLLSDPIVRSAIGLDYKDKKLIKLYNDEVIARSLNKILDDFLYNNLTVNDIYYKKDRISYIDNFSKDILPNKNDIKIQPTNLVKFDTKKSTIPLENQIYLFNNNFKDESIITVDNPTDTTSNGKNNVTNTKPFIHDNKNSWDRKHLIPSNFRIKIKNSRINDIYRELKSIDVNSYLNLTSISFRVFLELSIDEAIEVLNINSHANDKLKNKVQKVLKYLKDNKLIDDSSAKPVNLAISDNNQVLSINTLNAYVHNKNIFPDKKSINTSWNNIQNFIEILWQEIESKRK